MGSGVIYAAIVVAWAAVLIPRWLRRHDEAHDGTSGHGISRAMRVLSRRDDPAGERARQTRSLVSPDGPDVPPQPLTERSAAASSSRHARGRLAARRRRLLLGLLIATTVIAVLGVFAILPGWAMVFPGVLLVAYVVHLRVQTRHETELARRRAASRARIEARMRRIDSAERVVAARRERDEERVVAQTEAEREEAEVQAYEEADRLATQAAGWEPRRAPLPTYVTKPRAAPTARTIDVSSRGPWTGHAAGFQAPAASSSGATAMPVEGPVEETVDEAPLVEEIVEQRRVVND